MWAADPCGPLQKHLCALGESKGKGRRGLAGMPGTARVPRTAQAAGAGQGRFFMGVLVTGGAGYIGSHMLLELLDAGEDVTVIDDLSTGFERGVPERAKLVVGDVGDAALVQQMLAQDKIDAIIHFAGSIVVPESVREPLRYYQNNTCRSRTLIECAVNAGVKAFHFLFHSRRLWRSWGEPRV